MMQPEKNPIETALEDWLPACDFGVMHHGFLPHGRDYFFIIEDAIGPQPGTHRLEFTHVVETNYITLVSDGSWQSSWGEEFLNYQAWENAGEPDGYVWGTNWSNAYPGISTNSNKLVADQWTERLGKLMYGVKIETDRFSIELVFHDLRVEHLADDAPTVSKIIFPISS